MNALCLCCAHLQGWRIPFLVTIITTPIAIIMRMHM
jgi:hypothetical protein